MLATLRAAISLIALIGFFVFAVALSAGFIVIGVGVFHVLRTLGIWLIVVGAIASLGVLGALITVALTRSGERPGLDITREDAPELWDLVDEMSATARTPGPAHIRLVSGVNAFVDENARLLGLIPGARRMYMGVPLLQGLTVAQTRAVVAHEFGHYSGLHTRLGPVAYRGRLAVIETLRQLKKNVVLWPLRLYAGFYLLMSLAMSRSQEREADRLMVRAAGRANSQDALRELHLLRGWWSFYEREFLGMGWEHDLAPTAEEFFGGFGRLLVERAEELDEERRLLELPAEASLLDSHPPMAERVAVMEALPERGDPLPADNRPGSALIPSFSAIAAATAEKAYVFGYRQRLEWNDLVARACELNFQQAADRAYEAAARLTGEPTATLGTVAALSEAGRATKLVTAVSTELSAENVSAWFTTLVRAAAVQAGVARWRFSWTGSTELVTLAGEEFDAKPIANLLADAEHVREAVARLAGLGVDVAAVGPSAPVDTVDAGQIVAGFSDMAADGTTYDVLVLERGLVLADRPADAVTDGRYRLQTLERSSSIAGLVARHRYLPYASIASGKVSGLFTVKVRIKLRDGTTMRLNERWDSGRLNQSDDELLKRYLKAIT